MRQLVLDTKGDRKRAAILNNQVVVAFFEWEGSNPQNDEIYLTKVERLMPSLDGVFVSLSPDTKGFLSRHEWPETEAALFKNLKRGMLLLLQVKREAAGMKQTFMTRNIQIKGRSLIYLPFGHYVAASHRLKESDRDRLRNHPPFSLKGTEGVIFRSIAGEKTDEELFCEWEALRTKWRSVIEEASQKQSPVRLVDGDCLSAQLSLKLPSQWDCEWWTNEESDFRYLSAQGERVHLETAKPLFQSFSLEKEWEAAKREKVYLKSGVSIVIQQTEALTAIDVNSGSYKGKSTKEETAFWCNLEAVSEIARQLALRQIGGIIMIDLIKMEQESHREEVLNRFKEALKEDIVTTHVSGYTSLGLIEMTRKSD
ncbi:ribonuclease E/G [Pullulanibacillus sp. KACC 23026]|uniref:ribonuclease E/G n=1 Tax=Pullulanibacillus sp. KACC 23026 TaxID=3028315 RepID=UPI0023B0997E|nr:ribonuclease E/G [Pullulanibacillus sp. KACC 23026]WEG14057.1 ribonuclease E/G [Pullulanibacillus sp. KACC 23026]